MTAVMMWSWALGRLGIKAGSLEGFLGAFLVASNSPSTSAECELLMHT